MVSALVFGTEMRASMAKQTKKELRKWTKRGHTSSPPQLVQ
jgi:hypothetical protein